MKGKQLGYKKFGHLWRAAFGTHIGRCAYGYSLSKRVAMAQAKAIWHDIAQHAQITSATTFGKVA
jgi:hypothetical protein